MFLISWFALARRAGDGVKPGVERSGTPGSEPQKLTEPAERRKR